MIRCGELCKTCHGKCREDVERILVTCPVCEGTGCDACDGGDFRPGCPVRFVGDVVNVIEMAAMSVDGMLPVSGGLLDQSSWFMRFRTQLINETAAIREEQWERDSGK